MGVSLTTVRSVPMMLSCPVPLETDWHVSFLENFHSQPAPGNQRSEMAMGGQKIMFFNQTKSLFKPFHFNV